MGHTWQKVQNTIFVLAAIFAILMLGTLQRGTWLSLAVPALIWALIKREWKLPLIALVVIGFGLFAVHQKDPQQVKTLFHKLQQTDSSGRYEMVRRAQHSILSLKIPSKAMALVTIFIIMFIMNVLQATLTGVLKNLSGRIT